MPGLRVFRSLRPPFVDHVKIGPSLAKIPLDALLALSALRRALSGRYDVVHSHEEGGLIGVTLAMLLRVPHLYDMHSSLPQQLSNFAFSRSRIIKSVFLAIERFMIRRSRVVIVICPSLEETVKAIEPGARTVLIENAPGSSEDEATPAAAAAVRRSLQLGPSTPVVLYTGTFEAYQGLDLLFAAMAIVRRTRPDARLVLAGGKPDQVTKAREQARAAGIEDVTIFAGERPASEIPAYLLASRPARVAAIARHQHAAQDVPVPAIGQADRRDATADAHPGAERRHRDSHRRDAAGIRAKGLLAAPDRHRRAPPDWAVRLATLAETKYSYEAYLEQDPPGLRGAVAGAARGRGGQGRRVSREPSPDHYSYAAYADPAMAATLRQPPVRRADRRAGRHVAGARAREHGWAASTAARCSTSGTGTGRAALLLARGGARVTAVDASEEMLAIARKRAAEQMMTTITFQRGDAHALEFRRSQLRCGRQPARADAHAAVARCVVGAVPRRGTAGHRRLSLGDERRAARVAGATGDARDRREDRAVSSVHATPASPRPSSATASASDRCIGSSCCRLRFTRRSDRAGSRPRPNACSIAPACSSLFGSPVTLVAERCASSSPARPASPAGTSRARSRREATRVSALVARDARRPRALAQAGSHAW